MNKKELIIFVIFTFFVGFLGAFVGLKVMEPKLVTNENIKAPAASENSNVENENMQLIQEAYELIEGNYVEDVEDGQLLEGAIQGMIDTLDDPYSSYMNVEDIKEFNEQIESSFQGIGAEVSLVDGIVTIVSPIKNSPAEKAGLRPNDQILKVDDE